MMSMFGGLKLENYDGIVVLFVEDTVVWNEVN